MRTILEWYESIEDVNVRTVAINNFNEQGGSRRLNDKARDLAEAINLGFTWALTKEGADFWSNYYDSKCGPKYYQN